MSYYVIIPVQQITQRIMGECLNTDFFSLRKSVDGTLAVLKYPEGPKPNSLAEYRHYSQQEILEELQKPEWNNGFEP